MEERLAKYFSGELTQNEMEEIHSWRNETEENTKAYIEAKNIWLTSEALPAPNAEILNEILSAPVQKSLFTSYGWVKYAAAVAIVAVAFALLLLNRTDDLPMERLADGSEIYFHGNSSIESVRIDEEVREVKLNGRAYFDIQKDESRPFIIHTQDARIEVLGTSFMIDTYNNQTEVCVESGKVALVKPGGSGRSDLSIKLTDGEMGTVTKTNRGILKRNNNNPNYLAWKTKTLTFDRTKMVDVERVLEDVYGIQIQFENPATKNCNLTATFKERKAKDALEIIARTFNLTYEIKENRVLIKGKGC